MVRIHNIEEMKERRRELRRNSTKQEKILWEELRKNKLGYKFRRQHSIGGYVTDFYAPQANLVIEIDGGTHDSEEQRQYDKVRGIFINGLDIEVLRFKNEEVDRNLSGILEKIKAVLCRTLS